jgi:P-type conjugative transfer protein TrbJ
MTRTKIALTVATFVGVVAGAAPSARAQIPVTDAANLAQNITTAAKTAQTVINTYQQIQQLNTQIQNQLQMLKSIDPTSFAGLQALLSQGQFTYAMLQGDLSSIGYNIAAVNRGFDSMFPKSQSQWRNAQYSDFGNYYDRWNAEVTTASKAAVRAQSTISTIDADNRAMADILRQSNSSSTGQVRLLQLINQQLALIHKDLGAVVQNLATTGRVLTNWSSGAVGEQMMARERSRRRIDGYTNRGRPPRVLNRLP